MDLGGEVQLEFVKVDQPDAHLNFAVALSARSAGAAACLA